MVITKGGIATQLHHVVPHYAAMVTRELVICDNHPDRDYCRGLCSMGAKEDDRGWCGRMVPGANRVQPMPGCLNVFTVERCHRLCDACGAKTNGSSLTRDANNVLHVKFVNEEEPLVHSLGMLDDGRQ